MTRGRYAPPCRTVSEVSSAENTPQLGPSQADIPGLDPLGPSEAKFHMLFTNKL